MSMSKEDFKGASKSLIDDIKLAAEADITVEETGSYAEGRVVTYLIHADEKQQYDRAIAEILESEQISDVVTQRKVQCVEITVELHDASA